MTPQSISQRARELWESAKAQDGWDDSMRMAYIMGACDGMADMQEKCHPFKPKQVIDSKSMCENLNKAELTERLEALKAAEDRLVNTISTRGENFALQLGLQEARIAIGHAKEKLDAFE